VIALEACIDCDDFEKMERSVAAAFAGGAATLELCGEMEIGGLTPSEEAVRRSRALFPLKGLMAMVRPRGGGFAYSFREIEAMCGQIDSLGRAGADGVVFGVLDSREERIDEKTLLQLVNAAKDRGLRTTFHRAFDMLRDPMEGLEILVSCGVDRVLTSGIPWEGRKALLPRKTWLRKVAERNRGRLEMLVAGGISPENVVPLLEEILSWGPVGLVHAYSGIRENGETSPRKVALLRERIRGIAEQPRSPQKENFPYSPEK